MAKSTTYTYDRKSGRWRKGGKWSKPPRTSQLRRDVSGRLIDAAGKRVPAAAFPAGTYTGVALPAKRHIPAPSVPKPAKGAPRLRRGVEFIPQGESLTERRLVSSSFDNQQPPLEAGNVLYNLIRSKAVRSGKQPKDLLGHQYGINIINTGSRRITETGMARLVNNLSKEYPQFTYKFSADSLHINLGTEGKRAGINTMAARVQRSGQELEDIYNRLYDMWEGDLGWFAYFDTDDVIAGS